MFFSIKRGIYKYLFIVSFEMSQSKLVSVHCGGPC